MTQKTEAVLQGSDIRREMSTGDNRDERGLGRTGDDATQQKLVTALFGSTAKRWKTLYDSKDIYARIFQHRLAATLAFIDKLAMEDNSEILDVGCGAGLASVALADRGHFVEALDIAPAMLQSTREHALQAGVAHRVKARLGDVHQLAFPNDTFNVVIAIGLTAWLDSLQGPLQEIARVLQPGGYLIISAANRWSLHRLLDPRLNPGLAPARRAARRLLNLQPRRGTPKAAHYSFYSPQEFDSILALAGFKKLESTMVGFGPFSILGRKLLPDSAGVFVDRRLQQLADDKAPFIRSAGRIYLVLARKLEPG